MNVDDFQQRVLVIRSQSDLGAVEHQTHETRPLNRVILFVCRGLDLVEGSELPASASRRAA